MLASGWGYAAGWIYEKLRSEVVMLRALEKRKAEMLRPKVLRSEVLGTWDGGEMGC